MIHLDVVVVARMKFFIRLKMSDTECIKVKCVIKSMATEKEKREKDRENGLIYIFKKVYDSGMN